MSTLQQDIHNQIKFRTRHLQHGWAYFTLDEALRHDKSVPTWVYENPQLQKDRWTGLLDKDKKEIYEGDIVKQWNGWTKKYNNREVKYNESNLGFSELRSMHVYANTHYDEHRGLEVIGNIYENKELLS